jgi:hypothetical protein
MALSQVQILIGFWFLIAMVIMVTIWVFLRDIATHSYYAKKAKDHIVVEFVPRVTKIFVELIKLDDQRTGAFTYKDRKYFAGQEIGTIDYPPGRSALAQVTFHKCYADPASADMATNLHGKPTVDSVLVAALVQQKDTNEAMERSRLDSGGGKSMNQQLKWVYILVGGGILVSILSLVFTIKYQMSFGETFESFKATVSALATAMGVK